MSRLIDKLRFLWWQLMARLILASKGVKAGRGCRFYGLPIVRRAPGSVIELGERVVLCSDSRYTALGLEHPVVLRTLNPTARLVIGNDCGISGGTVCAAEEIQIGSEVLLGADVMIFDTDFHARTPVGRRYNANSQQIGTKRVRLGNNVFVGTRSLICKGVSIGENSIVGAGSVVVTNVPADCVAAGNPARAVSEL